MNPVDDDHQAGQALARLCQLIRRLRAPDGCPWDREQTAHSVAPYLLEEAYEAVEAVESGQPSEALEELGDLLFQVVFMVNLFAESGHFDLAQVIQAVTGKMTRRHPHVFGETKVNSSQEVKGLWGRIKADERKGRKEGLLDSVPLASPSLIRAQRLGQRAARVDFDWPEGQAVWQKIQEESRELQEAVGKPSQEHELGDLLFSLAQWARHAGLGAEQALRVANDRFVRRFKAMERLAGQRGLSLDQMSLAEMEALWEQAKAAERDGQHGALEG